MARLIETLLDFLSYLFGSADSGVPVGGRRGWLHLEGNGDQGWTARHSDKWYEPGGDPVRLTPEQARSLRLWAPKSGNVDYEAYMRSAEWAQKRNARLELDGYRCRLCDEDGAIYPLEVHHRPSAYRRLGNESIEDDLITLCSRHHKMITSDIRGDRYKRRKHEPITIQTIVLERNEVSHGMENSSLQVDIVGSVDHAQRADGGSTKQVEQIDQGDLVKARKDRSRSSGAGPS